MVGGFIWGPSFCLKHGNPYDLLEMDTVTAKGVALFREGDMKALTHRPFAVVLNHLHQGFIPRHRRVSQATASPFFKASAFDNKLEMAKWEKSPKQATTNAIETSVDLLSQHTTGVCHTPKPYTLHNPTRFHIFPPFHGKKSGESSILKGWKLASGCWCFKVNLSIFQRG